MTSGGVAQWATPVMYAGWTEMHQLQSQYLSMYRRAGLRRKGAYLQFGLVVEQFAAQVLGARLDRQEQRDVAVLETRIQNEPSNPLLPF